MDCRSPVVRRIATSGPIRIALICTSLLLVLISAVRFQAPEMLGQAKVLTDFDAFHIAGQMAKEGRADQTYHMREMLAAQREVSGTQSFMPWTYPPPFTLLMQGLAYVPIGMAFALFTLSSFAFYLWVLRRIAGEWWLAIIVAIMPVVLLNLRTGQNGFLIGGLIGCFLLAFRDGLRTSGVPLGLMVIKPHLAVGVGLIVLLKRRWSILVMAGLVAFALLGIATWSYGPGIWLDFRDAVKEASFFLSEGYYPLYRMSSIYASAFTFGLSALTAMALQATGAFLALCLLAKACLRGIDYHHLAAITCAASLFVSPYGYDYDLTILGVGLAFIIPDLLRRCSGRDVLPLLLLSWFVCGFGIAWTVGVSTSEQDQVIELDGSHSGMALIAPALILLCWYIARLLRQPTEDASWNGVVAKDS